MTINGWRSFHQSPNSPCMLYGIDSHIGQYSKINQAFDNNDLIDLRKFCCYFLTNKRFI